MSTPADEAGVSPGNSPRSSTLLRSILFRIVRIALLVVVLGGIVVLVWMKTTDDGQRAARDLTARWQDYWHGAEALAAAEKLQAMNVQLGTLPPDRTYITLDCADKQLGDDGFGLIGKCVQLQHVGLNHTDASDERLKCLVNLNRLTSLVIIDSPEVTTAGIRHLASTPELIGLCLIGTGVDDKALETISRLSELTTLDLSRTRVTDAGLPLLKNLKKLQWLLLVDTAVTDDGIAKLDRLPKFQRISLRGSKVTEKGQKLLKEMYPRLTID